LSTTRQDASYRASGGAAADHAETLRDARRSRVSGILARARSTPPPARWVCRGLANDPGVEFAEEAALGGRASSYSVSLSRAAVAARRRTAADRVAVPGELQPGIADTAAVGYLDESPESHHQLILVVAAAASYRRYRRAAAAGARE
jgi:hypothetical protein